MFIDVIGASGSKNAVDRIVCMKLGRQVLIDAGSASFIPVEELDLIDAVILTHAHLDHILDLGFVLDSMVAHRQKPLIVMGSEACLSIVRSHYMNGLIWPDFTKIQVNGTPILEYQVLADHVWKSLPGGIECMPVPVNHPAGARGFLFRNEGKLVVYSGDTGPTESLWKTALHHGKPSSVVIEVSFPDSQRDIALASDHLCPSLVLDELRKLGCPGIPLYLFHMKPWFTDEIMEQTEHLLPGAHFMQQGERIRF